MEHNAGIPEHKMVTGSILTWNNIEKLYVYIISTADPYIAVLVTNK